MRAAVCFLCSTRVWLGLLFLGAPVASAGAASAKPPTSKLYVADLVGEADINTGPRIERLDEKSVHIAQGTITETNANSTVSFVLSNGTGVFLATDTRFEIRRFLQEPFWPNRDDLEVEPSMSHLHATISRGTVGLCTPRLVAGSTMICDTPHASVSIRGQRLLIESRPYETRVSVLEGDVTVRAGDRDAGGAMLRGGQQAIVRQALGQSPSVEVREIPAEERTSITEQLAMSCMARRTVYFDVGEGEVDPIAIPAAPITPPLEFVDDDTVSASRIRG
jgi:hypothetical protein